MLWRPNICAGGRCVLEWAAGSNWTPDEPWDFLEVCAAHRDHPDKTARLAALQAENQRMSYCRKAVGTVLELLKPDGQLDTDGETIGFAFDDRRQLTLIVPDTAKAILVTRTVEVSREVAKVAGAESVRVI